MRNSRSLRGVPRSSRSSLRVMAIGMTLVFALASTHPWPVLAQDVLNCSGNGFCLSGSINSLLGLPNGTLKIVGYQPWDRVVKGGAAERCGLLSKLRRGLRLPLSTACPTTIDCRTRRWTTCGVHVHAPPLAGQAAGNNDDASHGRRAGYLGHLESARQRSPRTAKRRRQSTNLSRWQSDPCHYTVPAGFGFEQYDPGPQCRVGGVVLAVRRARQRKSSSRPTAPRWR